MSTTYNDLVTNIKNYSGRTDSATLNAIPQFIQAAQTKLDGELRIAAMGVSQEYEAEGVTILGVNMLKIESILIGGLVGTVTTLADVVGLRQLTAAIPAEIQKYSALYNININDVELVAPAEVVISGYRKPDRISQSVQTNAYTDAAENALLWYSLMYCGVFARDTEAAQSWGGMADAEVSALNESHRQFQLTGTATEVRRGYF